MSYVQYVIDIESTGLDPIKNDIIEVCFWRLGDAESKTWWLTPLSPENIEEEALQINKHLREDILHQTKEGREKYRHPSEVLPEIEMWLMEDGAAAEERVFIGQNPMFDYEFLLALWRKMKVEKEFPFGYWIPNRDGTERNQGYIIDTMQLARFIDVCTGKKRARYGLGALVKDFGVTKSTAHRADGDVKMTKELYEKMIGVLRDPIIGAFNETY
jgi:DNA polymerase III alpha subunit (gram-positive type)